MRIDISKADKAEVFMHLYNGAINQGRGIHPMTSVFQMAQGDMTLEQARRVVESYQPRLSFDYINGRSMKVDISKDVMELKDYWLYDRDCGEGAIRRSLAGVPGVVFIEEAVVANEEA